LGCHFRAFVASLSSQNPCMCFCGVYGVSPGFIIFLCISEDSIFVLYPIYVCIEFGIDFWSLKDLGQFWVGIGSQRPGSEGIRQGLRIRQGLGNSHRFARGAQTREI